MEKSAVANVSQIVALDRRLLEEPLAQLSSTVINRLLAGIDIVLGRQGSGLPGPHPAISR